MGSVVGVEMWSLVEVVSRVRRAVARVLRLCGGHPRVWGGFVGQVTYDEDVFAPLSEGEVADWEEAALFPEDVVDVG